MGAWARAIQSMTRVAELQALCRHTSTNVCKNKECLNQRCAVFLTMRTCSLMVYAMRSLHALANIMNNSKSVSHSQLLQDFGNHLEECLIQSHFQGAKRLRSPCRCSSSSGEQGYQGHSLVVHCTVQFSKVGLTSCFRYSSNNLTAYLTYMHAQFAVHNY